VRPVVGQTPTTRGCLPIVVTLLIVAGFLSVVQAEQPAAAEPECDPAAVMNHRLDELDRSGYAWTIEALEGYRGLADIDARRVTISPKVGCDLMPAVVNHEWMHVQQGHKWGSSERLFQAVGEFEVEMVADCGSMLLGSTVTPYITSHRQETGDRGCSEYELDVARELIDKAGGRLLA
jgi:hypothetical protein